MDVDIEVLAEAAHNVWMEDKISDGWTYAPVTDKAAKQHASLVPYSSLIEADKEGNRSFVRGIPAILAKAGCVIARKSV